jgi:3-isopropylmalate dehydrogenase
LDFKNEKLYIVSISYLVESLQFIIITEMNSYNILVLPGDGVGPEIIAEAVRVLGLVSKYSDIKFNITSELLGGCSIDKHGVALTDEVLNLAKKSDAVLFGAVGGPKW